MRLRTRNVRGVQQPRRGVPEQDRVDRFARSASAQRAQGGQHGQVGLADAVLLDALAARNAQLRAGGATEIVEHGIDQSRLADAGLTDDEPDLAAARDRRSDPLGDVGSLASATDDRRAPGLRALGCRGLR